MMDATSRTTKLFALVKRVEETLSRPQDAYFDPLTLQGMFETYDKLRAEVVSSDPEYYEDVWCVEKPTPRGNDFEKRGHIRREAVERLCTAVRYLVRLHRRDISPPVLQARRVFVAYGHNERARIALFSFLRALNLQPMEWAYLRKQAGKPGASTPEVVDTGVKLAGAFVILLTPDEEVKPSVPQKDGPPAQKRIQARPNVLAELGLTWSQDRSRTVIVSLGGAEPPSNFAGIQMVKIDNTPAQRRQLASMLEIAGCPVDDDGVDWLTPEAGGDFDGAMQAPLSPNAIPDTGASAEDEKRRKEIASEAADGFIATLRPNTRPNTQLLLQWVKSGHTMSFGHFDFDILRRAVAELRRRGHEQLSVPTKEEFQNALDEWDSRPQGYEVIDG